MKTNYVPPTDSPRPDREVGHGDTTEDLNTPVGDTQTVPDYTGPYVDEYYVGYADDDGHLEDP